MFWIVQERALVFTGKINKTNSKKVDRKSQDFTFINKVLNFYDIKLLDTIGRS